MQEADVIRIVESTISDKNLGLLASMKSLLDTSLTDLKRSHADTADSQLKEIKKLNWRAASFQEERERWSVQV